MQFYLDSSEEEGKEYLRECGELTDDWKKMRPVVELNFGQQQQQSGKPRKGKLLKSSTSSNSVNSEVALQAKTMNDVPGDPAQRDGQTGWWIDVH